MPASDRSQLATAFASVRGQLGLVALLLTLAAAGWAWTSDRMAGMDAGPGTDLGALGWFVGIWVVMMAAMMLPSLAPTVALYGAMTRTRFLGRPLLFTVGYLLVWALAGVAAYVLFRLGRTLFGGALAWRSGGRWVAAAVLGGAAIYQLTPVKDVCLAKCRSPVGFLTSTWRDGHLGPVEMGVRQAGWCLGCCSGLMVALFALGVMSLTWMAVIAALVALEKTVPWRGVAVWSSVAVLLALTIGILIAPHAVPGLTVPGGVHDAMNSMGAMR